MRWSIALAFIGFVSVSNIASAQPSSAGDSLILSTGCARFHFVLGRIELDAYHYKKLRLSNAAPEPSEDEEFVCVTARQGIPSLHYLRDIGESRVTIDVMDVRTLRVESETVHPSGVTETLLVTQPANGPIEIVSTLGNRTQKYRSRSFWHLLVEEPSVFEEQVNPMLRLMMDDFNGHEFRELVHKSLQKQVARGVMVTEQEVRSLVDKLASPKRSVRTGAHKRLMATGLAAMPILKKLDPKRLEPEQLQRVSQLLRRWNSGHTDTPARVAKWLSTDRDYWIQACKQWTPQQQHAASEYMMATLGKGLDAVEGPLAIQVADASR